MTSPTSTDRSAAVRAELRDNEFLRSNAPIVASLETRIQTAHDAAIAAASSATLTERQRANQLLQNAYLPLLQRRAEAPERHAQTLQPAAEQLVTLVEQHLAIELGGVSRGVAGDVAARLRSEFAGIVGIVA